MWHIFPRSWFQHEGKWCQGQRLEPNASLAKGSLRDAWIAVHLKQTELRLTTRGHLALFQQWISKNKNIWASRPGSRWWPMNKKKKKGEIKYYCAFSLDLMCVYSKHHITNQAHDHVHPGRPHAWHLFCKWPVREINIFIKNSILYIVLCLKIINFS